MREVSWNDYYSMHYVGMPDYCGQAEAVCYTVTVPEKRRYLQSIVWQDLKSGKKRTVSAGGSTETFARFSPESKSSRIILAFLSDADGTSQIYRYVCADEDWEESCEKLTDIPGGVREFVWSPDGKKIAFLAGSGEKQGEGRTPFDPIVIEDYGYRSDEAMGFADRKKDASQLWMLTLEDKKVTLMDAAIMSSAIKSISSPDSKI